MLDQIRKLLLLALAAGLLKACAAKQEPQLVSTGADRESSLPWNKQERWEGTGQFGPLADEMGRR
jgi:outer membrane biogenesis lipoprotein LolB